jgi:hypothetical protein
MTASMSQSPFSSCDNLFSATCGHGKRRKKAHSSGRKIKSVPCKKCYE